MYKRQVTDDALSFDVPNLIMAKPVNTAFDILGEIPGLVKEGDNVSIIGVPATNIIINGRRSSMSVSYTHLEHKTATSEMVYASRAPVGL